MSKKLLLGILVLLWLVLTVVKPVIGFVSIIGYWPVGFLFIPIIIIELVLSWSMYVVSGQLVDQGIGYRLLSVFLLLNLVTVVFLTVLTVCVVGLGAVLALFTLL